MISHKTLGLGIMVFAVILFIIGFSYVKSAENALMEGHSTTQSGACTHAEDAICPYEKLNELAVPKYTALFLDIALFIAGFIIFIRKTPQEAVMKKAKKHAKDLGAEEGKVFELLTDSNGMIFQNELVEKLQLSKVKVTRLLDKLEAKGLIERRRRGMTNVIIAK